MASPQPAASGSQATDANVLDDLVDSETDSGSSYVPSDESSHNDPPSCAWRTAQFHDQECSRYFDCPSHLVERMISARSSIADPNQAAAATTAITIDDIANIHRDIFQPPAESQTPVDIYSSSPARSTSREIDDSEHPPTPPTNQSEAPLPMPDSEVRTNMMNLWEGRAGSQPSPPTDEPGNSSRDQDDTIHEPQTLNELAPPGQSGLENLASLSLEDSQQQTPRFAYQPTSRDIMENPFSRTPDQGLPPLPRLQGGDGRRPSDVQLPRWQADAEVTYCPICHTQFSFFVRKHHCRKCGRVVCNACSPHRIIIPYQYIVRPAGSEVTMPQSLLIDGLRAGYFDVDNMSGGERVRLCNPCVPDPNTAPPQSPSPAALSPRASHQRSRSSNSYVTLPSSNRHGAIFASGPANEYRYLPHGHRTRSITMASGSSHASSSSGRRRSSTIRPSGITHILANAVPSTSYPSRQSSLTVASSSRHRALPPTPQIAEEDECPVCHRELPSRSLANFEALRETHITSCIQTHSTYGTPREGARPDDPPPAPRRTGMYTYPATEKDCIDDAECTICLEEFTVGVPMARLECLCRFHRSCISAWFINHPGRCPVHQHDGFGY